MFGLEDQKKKKPIIDTFLFELEKELKIPEKQIEFEKLMEKRLMAIKLMLQGGGEHAKYEQLGVFLNGYHSLLKVASRIVNKPK